jgi:hypothetical protein
MSVPNEFDTLQYIRINLSAAGANNGTNLQTNTSYKNTLNSWPTADLRKKVSVNTTGTGWSEESDYYNITNMTKAPVIALALVYNNTAGGYDLYSANNARTPTNIISFNLSITNPSILASGGQTLSNALVGIQFDTHNMGATSDAVNITIGTNTSTSGTTLVTDSDSSNHYERITWSGNLAPSTTVYLTFNATLQFGVNIDNNEVLVNLDTNTSNKGAGANYTTTSALTGITITGKLSKGPIRQGIDMNYVESLTTWQIRGFIKNMANASLATNKTLTYNITGWRIYSVNQAGGAPFSTANQTGLFNATATSSLLIPSDDLIYTTGTRSSNNSWYSTGSPGKPYYTVYFDWYVAWNDTNPVNYASYINTTLDLPRVYKIDMSNAKAISGLLTPDTGNQNITIEDNSTHLGSSNATAKYVEIYSVVPANTTTNAHHGWFDISTASVRAFYVNSTGVFEINTAESNVSVTVTDPGAGGTSNGLVNLTLKNVVNVKLLTGGNNISHTLTTNEKISLLFNCTSNLSMTTGDTYNFTGNTTMITPTGTPITENHTASSISITSRRLLGYKTLIVYDPNDPTVINTSIVVEVQSSSGQNVSGIKFLDYVANIFTLAQYKANVTVIFYNGATNATWVEGTNYNITDNSTVTLSDGSVAHAFEFKNATGDGTFTLTNGQYIMVNYRMNVTGPGTYILPVELFGLDPVTGESLRTMAFGAIRIDIPEPALPLQITENDLSQAKRILVGNPGMWVKTFEVYNPNPRPVASTFSTDVFSDTSDAYATYNDISGQKLDEIVVLSAGENGGKAMTWKSTIEPFETRSYEIRVMTPAVMEIDRDVEVLEKMEDKKVKIKMDVYIKSFAKESYENVILNIPLPYENIIEVKDGFGNKLQFTGGSDSTTISADKLGPEELKTITIIYKQSYPTIIITPDRDRYDMSAPVSLEIMVINGGEEIDYPFIEVEVYTPGMDVIYSNMEKLEKMDPLEKTDLYQKFSIPATAPSGMYVASARFREDFATLASTTGYFFVSGTGGAIPEAAQILIVIIISALLVYFSVRKIRDIRTTSSAREKTGEEE